MSVPRSVRRRRRKSSDAGGSTAASTRTTRAPSARRTGRGARTALGAGPTVLLIGSLATGTLEQIQWGERGLELSPAAAIAVGLVLFAGVGAAVFSLRNRHGRVEGDDRDGLEGETETSAVLTGDAIEGMQAVLRRDGGDWTWRVLRREALAESPAGAPTQSTATARIERTRDAIEAASLREVTDAAVRVYRDGNGDGGDGDDAGGDDDGTWRWSLVRADGSRVATAAEGYDDRDDADAAVSFLKDHGPDADVVDVEAAAITIAERRDRWRWQLVDDERTPLAASADGYDRRADAAAAAETFAERIADARVLDVEAFGVELYPLEGAGSAVRSASKGGANSEADSESERGSEADLASEAESEAEAESGSKPEPTAEEADGGWSWRLVDEDGDVVADATVAFETRLAAEDAATAALAALEDAAVTDAGEPAFERYPDPGPDRAAGDGDDDGDRHRDGDRDRHGNGDAWRWRLVDDAGRTVARAPVAAPTADEAERATDLFREAAPDAAVLEIDEAAYEVYPDPDAALEDGRATDMRAADSGGASRSRERAATDTDAETPAVTDGAGTAGTADGWRWRLVTTERDVVAESARAYADAEAATTALDRVREEVREADVVAFETAAFRVYETDDGDWRWRLLDAGGTVLADSDGEHDSRNEAIEAMLTLKERAPDAEVAEIDAPAFELVAREDGAWSWRLLDAAGRRVAEAPTPYASRADARAAVDRLRDRSNAPVHAVESATFQPDATDGGWRWRFVRPSGETLAVSGGEYPTRDELVERIDDVRETAAAAREYTTGAVTVQLLGDETWRWSLLDRDREPILESTAAYADREAARSVVGDLKRASDVPVFAIESDGAAIWLERDGDGWRWDLLDRDREVLATAAETADKSETTATIESVRRLAPLADRIDVAEASFDVVERDGGWRWRLLNGDGDPVAIAADVTETNAAAREAIADVRSLLESASVFELESAAFELSRTDGDEPWRWRLVDENGETLLESAQSYETRAAAQEAIGALKSHAPDGELTVAE
ncbi:DUF1508 domain-containing protein [Halopiger thermotolerans]